MRCSVSHHALWRWRERVALYGDAPAEDCASAFLDSAKLVGDGEVLPFKRVPNTRYWQHTRKPYVYFVTEPRGIGEERIVTVIDVYERLAPLAVTQKITDANGKHWDYIPDPNTHGFEPTFANVGEKREWYIALCQEAQEMLTTIPKKHPKRFVWAKHLGELQHKVAEVKTEYKQWKARLSIFQQLQARDRKDAGQQHRSGSDDSGSDCQARVPVPANQELVQQQASHPNGESA